MDQPGEILDGNRLIGTLHGVIESRRVCRMEIPNTKYSWITLILEIQAVGDSQYLLIDKVAGFEKTFSRLTNRDVFLEFLEKDGVPCQFNTRVIECHPKVILAELPNFIYRMQKRRFVRVKARLGTEIIFPMDPAKEERAKVEDYGLGGVAFFMNRPLKIYMGDQLTDIELRIPLGIEMISFHISLAMMRWFEPPTQGKYLHALEFLEMEEKTKERLWRHIFKEQRILLQKTRKI